jgi:hypothetical protein
MQRGCALVSLGLVLLLTVGPARVPQGAPRGDRTQVGRRRQCAGVPRGMALHLRGGGGGGGGISSAPYGADASASVKQIWEREFDQLSGPASQSRLKSATLFSAEGEAEALFRHAFFLTHYQLDFVNARQLLERVLALNPQHVPALTTLVSPVLPR